MLASETGTRTHAAARAALYCRVSTDEQAEAGTIGIQLHNTRRYAEAMGFDIVATYKDEGWSGAIPIEQRPDGKRMMADARKNAFDALIIWKLDRLGRDVISVLQTVDELDKQGVAFYSVTEQFNTAPPFGRLVLTVMAAIAEMERSVILQRTNEGKIKNAREGKWAGGAYPYGYRIDEAGYLIEYPPEADIVRMIYDMYVNQKMGTPAITTELNVRGIPSPYANRGYRNRRSEERFGKMSGRWAVGSVARLLQSPTCMGKLVYNNKRAKEPIVIEVPPIVDAETWERAQEQRRDTYSDMRRTGKRKYLLAGLIKCGMCGLTYVGRLGGSQNKTTYYYCGGKEYVSPFRLQKCESALIRAEPLENAVWADIRAFALNPGEVLSHLAAQAEQGRLNAAEIERQIAEIGDKLEAGRQWRQEVLRLRRVGKITEDDMVIQLDELAHEERKLLVQKDKLFEKQLAQEQTQERLKEAAAVLERIRGQVDNASFEAKRDLVRRLVDHIIVETVGEGRRKKAKATVVYCFTLNRPEGDVMVNVVDLQVS
ncbi:MAG: recombinase family protein [Anaerolineae bacterium]